MVRRFTICGRCNSRMTKIKQMVALTTLLLLAVGIVLVWPSAVPAQNESALAARIREITGRPEYKHASFGIEVYSLDDGKVLYALNGQQLFTPASTTKLLTEGTALELLGADYRFHTRVYRTGAIAPDGTLNGDLILVASGDPNLSGRIQPDGTLAFQNEDHSYDASPDTKAVPGDPLLVIRELASQVAAKGIKRVAGRVLVDASLFPEGGHEDGTQAVISPICVNDNIIDVSVSPGPVEGAPVGISISPATSYAKFVNQAVTGPANSKPNIQPPSETVNPDGSYSVVVSGTFPLGKSPILYSYDVPVPSRFAQVAFAEALREKGIAVTVPPPSEQADFAAAAASYTAENIVAEHISLPLAEDVKVTLKVSQNLHASMTPFILGAALAHKTKDADQAGFDLEREFLTKAGLDLTGASQGDGAGGAQSAYFTPEFMVQYLAYWSKRPDYKIFYDALPILGRDGTLWNIQPDSPAAGFVHAKTGTFSAPNALTKTTMVTGKGLAGYMTTALGEHLAFAIYANHVTVPRDLPDAATKIVGQALGEIAAAAWNWDGHPFFAIPDPRGADDFDILIRNGHIVDGSGNP